MNYQRAVWRSRTVALTLLLFTGRGVVGQAGQSLPWPFQLEWEYQGPPPTSHQLCVDNACSALSAVPFNGQTWRAPLPVLPLGEHRLVVRACVENECASGTPELFVRILPPSPRRPPIDIIEGPRIPVNHR